MTTNISWLLLGDFETLVLETPMAKPVLCNTWFSVLGETRAACDKNFKKANHHGYTSVALKYTYLAMRGYLQ